MKKRINKKVLINILVSLGIAMVLVGIDQLTKFLAVKYLTIYDEIPFIKGIINFKLVYNTGFAFGLGDGYQWIWSIVSIIGCIIIGYFMKKADFHHNLLYTICLILLFAGTFGNMIDRIFSEKGVIDFLNPAFVDFAVFNVADSYITIGAILLAVYIIFFYKEEDKTKQVNDDNNLSSPIVLDEEVDQKSEEREEHTCDNE